MLPGTMAAIASSAIMASPWSGEAPQLAQWIVAGRLAQQQGDLSGAAAHYCSAARFGSGEAQFRLALLYLQVPSEAAHWETAVAVLHVAAQQGHALAQVELERLAHRGVTGSSFGALPACLSGGDPPRFGVAALPAPPSVAVPQPPVSHEAVQRYVAALPAEKRRHAQLIQRLAPRYGVDGRLALAIARVESSFDPSAVSPRNARGLMQLMPETADRFGVRNPFDPEQNVRGALAHLRWLLQRFDEDVALVSAAYNAGEGMVERYGGVPPFPETRAYVQRI
ncbi:lytic transglycosylase domain-containing protein, partial [Tepidimonas sp.]|uniref:lytic transglycosylase domain-containing protein n=1 Tax=Tepidimonas sp. TaxID=2002775 RepID=UPI002FE106FB